MKQEALVQTLIIERIGEMRHFQILLPRDTKRIIGFEYAASEKWGENPVPPAPADTALTFVRNKVIGSLLLRTTGCDNTFYQSDLIEDRNVHFGETIAPAIWNAMPWSHGKKRHELELNVPDNGMVYGFFRDSWGTEEYGSLYYQLHLYLWIEKCEQ